MPKFNFDGLKETIELPDEYLTVGQIEQGYRALVSQGTEQLDLNDPASGRILAEALLGDKAPDFVNLVATPQNMKNLLKLYAHVGDLFSKSMAVGDEIVEEVEAKKEVTEVKSETKKRGRPRSKSTSTG